jgi:hypothetical protein
MVKEREKIMTSNESINEEKEEESQIYEEL